MRYIHVAAGLLLCASACGHAQVRGRILATPGPGAPVDYVYWPGEVNINLGLEEFLPGALHDAATALRGGSVAAAQKAFGEEEARNPDDLAAEIGYLQSMRGKLEGLLPKYKRDVARAPSAADHFKLGVLAYYLYGTLWRDIGDEATTRKHLLGKLALDNLEAAYKHAPEPIVGFTLALAYEQVGRPLVVDYDKRHVPTYRPAHLFPVYEDMLRRLGGDEAYGEYVAARRNGWAGPTPTVKPAPRQKLRLMSYLVGTLWAHASGRGGRQVTRAVNGKTTTVTEWDTIPPERERQIAWLWNWRQKIRQAWGWKPAASNAGK